ncbi:EnvZ/OmpR regulon moderator, partial [Salmonella enterica subsp. enterica serovar Dublin]
LDQTLPHGYVVAQQDDDNETVQWLSRLRESSHRFG